MRPSRSSIEHLIKAVIDVIVLATIYFVFHEDTVAPVPLALLCNLEIRCEPPFVPIHAPVFLFFYGVAVFGQIAVITLFAWRAFSLVGHLDRAISGDGP
jgi:hypothetical protein